MAPSATHVVPEHRVLDPSRAAMMVPVAAIERTPFGAGDAWRCADSPPACRCRGRRRSWGTRGRPPVVRPPAARRGRAGNRSGGRRVDPGEGRGVRRPGRRRNARRRRRCPGSGRAGAMPVNAPVAVGEQRVVPDRSAGAPPASLGARPAWAAAEALRSTVGQRIAVDDEESIGGERAGRARARPAGRAQHRRLPRVADLDAESRAVADQPRDRLGAVVQVDDDAGDAGRAPASAGSGR